MKFKKLLLSAIAALSITFNASAMDDGCNQAERDPNASVPKYNIQTKTWQYDIWRLSCGTTTQVLIKLYPGEGQDSSEPPSYWWEEYNNSTVSQNGKELAKQELYGTRITVTKTKPLYKSYSFANSDIDVNAPLVLWIEGTGEATLYPTSGGSNQGVFTVTGSWYDPAYNGSGYNVVEAPNGLVVYFYGYKGGADGQAQWLASDVGPATITKGQSMQLKMYSSTVGNGGSFTTKPSVGSGIAEWGTATITFNSCNAGTIVLDGNDGKITHNVVKLANVKNLTCAE